MLSIPPMSNIAVRPPPSGMSDVPHACCKQQTNSVEQAAKTQKGISDGRRLRHQSAERTARGGHAETNACAAHMALCSGGANERAAGRTHARPRIVPVVAEKILHRVAHVVYFVSPTQRDLHRSPCEHSNRTPIIPEIISRRPKRGAEAGNHEWNSRNLDAGWIKRSSACEK